MQEGRDSLKPNKVSDVPTEKYLLRAYSVTPHQAYRIPQDYAKMKTPALHKRFIAGQMSPLNGPFMEEKHLFASSAVDAMKSDEGFMSQLTKSQTKQSAQSPTIPIAFRKITAKEFYQAKDHGAAYFGESLSPGVGEESRSSAFSEIDGALDDVLTPTRTPTIVAAHRNSKYKEDLVREPAVATPSQASPTRRSVKSLK